MAERIQLYYIHDPMCSWCWGFAPCWHQLKQQLADNIQVVYLLGGLAADSDQTMPASQQVYLQDTWRRIQQHIPGTQFNFDFWTQCRPIRSTYPACRAVIAAGCQSPTAEQEMILAIQQAYYLNAQNPAEAETLLACATSLKLDRSQFIADLNSPATESRLQKEIQQAEWLGAQGYPSLILSTAAERHFIDIDYCHPQPMLDSVKQFVG